MRLLHIFFKHKIEIFINFKIISFRLVLRTLLGVNRLSKVVHELCTLAIILDIVSISHQSIFSLLRGIIIAPCANTEFFVIVIVDEFFIIIWIITMRYLNRSDGR